MIYIFRSDILQNFVAVFFPAMNLVNGVPSDAQVNINLFLALCWILLNYFANRRIYLIRIPLSKRKFTVVLDLLSQNRNLPKANETLPANPNIANFSSQRSERILV